jgi:hypothetical protein
MKPLELAGNRYGALLVVGRAESSGRHIRWDCKCDCGASCAVIASNLTRLHTVTCGASVHRRKPEGTKVTANPAYMVWLNMRRRCSDPNATSYPRYGAKGVRVCSEWESFDRFIADMGERPSTKHQIDRIDSGAGYCKSNCRWVTAGENSRNRSFVKLSDSSAAKVKALLSDGKTCREAADVVGVSRASVLDVSRGRTWKHVPTPTVAPDGVIPPEGA